MIGGKSCTYFLGACEDVLCVQCPDRPIYNGDSGDEDDAQARAIWNTPPRVTPIRDGDDITVVPVNSSGTLDPEDMALFLPDNVMHPNHYARWAMEPIEFIAINNLPWWLANVIKYTMRFDAKDGLQDLYKARSYLEMKIREVEGEKRFWDKPVAEERKLNDVSTQNQGSR
jgi:hypothetical protein